MKYDLGLWLRDFVIVFGAGIIIRGLVISGILWPPLGLMIVAILVGYLIYNLSLLIKK